MAFYNMEGKELDVNDFVSLYANAYFIGNEKIHGISYTQTSQYVEEDEIMKILKNHFESYTDVAKAMAWKIGRIRHMDSEKQKKIVYASDWEKCEKENPKRYGRMMDLRTLSDYILDNRDKLEKQAKDNPQECLKTLRKPNINGIGTVYLITLLFFLSHGKWPIYDRFAMAALDAEKNDICPHEQSSFDVRNLPGKWDKDFEILFKKDYGDYIQKLDSLKYDYRTDRKLDRALWIYGHAFQGQAHKR